MSATPFLRRFRFSVTPTPPPDFTDALSLQSRQLPKPLISQPPDFQPRMASPDAAYADIFDTLFRIAVAFDAALRRDSHATLMPDADRPYFDTYFLRARRRFSFSPFISPIYTPSLSR
jgi:hypothetical protein